MNKFLPAFKKSKFLIVLFSLVLLSGCMKIEYNMTVQEDGSALIEMIQDISAMKEMTEGAEGGTEDPCADVSLGDDVIDINCVVENDGNMVRITGKKLAANDGSFESLNGFYRLRIENMGEGMMEGSETMSAEEKTSQKVMLNSMGVSFVMNISLPGEILSTDVGTLENNMVTIDAFDMPETTNDLFIVSKGPDATGSSPWAQEVNIPQDTPPLTEELSSPPAPEETSTSFVESEEENIDVGDFGPQLPSSGIMSLWRNLSDWVKSLF